MNWKISPLNRLDDGQKRKLREQLHLLFVAAIWIGLFVLMFAYSAKHRPKDMPIEMEPRIPTGSAKFY